MKKRIKIIFSFILILLVLTGCTSFNKQQKIIKQLQKHKIIEKNWEQENKITTNEYSLFNDIISYDYIYKTKDNTYNVVRILDNEEEYTIEIQYDVYYYSEKTTIKNADGEDEETLVYKYESPRRIRKIWLNPNKKQGFLFWTKWVKEEKSDEEVKDNDKTSLNFQSITDVEYGLTDDSIIKVDKENNGEEYVLKLTGKKEGTTILTIKYTSKSSTPHEIKYKVTVNNRLDIRYEISN